jgi:osmotically-inducible protein OsmY
MDRKNNWLRLAIFLWLISLLASCAATPSRESTGEYIDDAAITTKVKTAIFQDPSLKVFQIDVETYKGVVELSGFVDSANVITHATEVAEKVKGVKSVKNELKLKSSVGN